MTALRNLLIALALLWTLPADAANRFGVCTAACTWDSSSTAMWSATSGGSPPGTGGASVPGSGDTVTFDAATCIGGVTCTITIAAATNPTIQSFTWGACTASTTGCIIDNSANNNFTMTVTPWFSGTGTGTRTFTGGSGTYTVSGNFAGGNAWQMANVTGLSNPTTAFLNATIVLAGTGTIGGIFSSGGLPAAVLTLTGHASKGGYQLAGGANAYGVMNITAPNFVAFQNAVTTTITTAFNWSGTSANRIMVASTSALSVATIAIGSDTATLDWGILRGITTSGGTARNATNTLDQGMNTWSSITAPPAGGGHVGIIGSLAPDKTPANDNLVCEGFVGRLPLRWGWKKCA